MASTTTTTAVEVRDLDSRDALAYVAGCRRDADREEAHLLAGVVHFIDLHPVTDQSPAATPRSRTRFLADANDGQGLVEPPLGGPGTPGVAEFAVEELAAALGVSYPTGLQLAVEAVELCYRLPRLWALVQDGVLQAWKARQVARATTGLSPAAVAFVDAQVAVTGRHNKIPALGAVVHEARLQCDPDQAAGVEQAALDARGVWLDHRESTATTQLNARLDTLDALDLDNAVTDLATTMGTLGDDRPLDVRRATALGLLANPQRALDLFRRQAPTLTLPGTNPVSGTGDPTGACTGDATGASTGPDGALGSAAVITETTASTTPFVPAAAGQSPGATGATAATGCPGGLNGSRAVLYLHISAADLATTSSSSKSGSGSGSGGCSGGGIVEKLGPATLALLRDWLQRPSGVPVRPVLDMAATGAVDAHAPPAAMRKQVTLRDRHCVSPGCTVDARRCDLDH